MALPLANNANGGTDGTLVSSANSGGASGDPFDVVATGTIMRYGVDQSAHGGMAYRIPQGATFATGNLEWTASIGGAQATLWGRAYYRFSSVAPSANMNLIRWASSGTNCANLRINTTGTIQFTNTSGVAAGTPSAALSADTWYRIEYTISFSTTAGSATANIYLLDDTTPVTSTSCTGQNFAAASATTVRTGNIAAGATNMTTWVDDIQVNNTGFPGPVAGGGGAAVDLTATSAGTSATTADLQIAAALTAQSDGTSATTADMAVARPLQATSAGTSSTAGGLAVAKTFAATSAGTSTTAGGLVVSVVLAATTAGASTTTGALSVAPAGLTLSGTTAGTSTTTGSLAVARTLSATSSGTSATTAALRVAETFTATTTGTSATTGVLRVLWALSGASAGTSTTTGQLTVAGPVTAVGWLEDSGHATVAEGAGSVTVTEFTTGVSTIE